MRKEPRSAALPPIRVFQVPSLYLFPNIGGDFSESGLGEPFPTLGAPGFVRPHLAVYGSFSVPTPLKREDKL